MVEGKLQDNLRAHREPDHEHGRLAYGRDERGTVPRVVFDPPRWLATADGLARATRVERGVAIVALEGAELVRPVRRHIVAAGDPDDVRAGTVLEVEQLHVWDVQERHRASPQAGSQRAGMLDSRTRRSDACPVTWTSQLMHGRSVQEYRQCPQPLPHSSNSNFGLQRVHSGHLTPTWCRWL